MPDNIVSGQIAVNITATGGTSAGAFSGTPPKGPGGSAGSGSGINKAMLENFLPEGFKELNPHQKAQMQAQNEANKLQKEVANYNKSVMGGGKEGVIGKGMAAMGKMVPMIGALLGIGGMVSLIKHSAVMSTTLSAIGQIITALVDITLMPFMPIIAKGIQAFASIIPLWADFIKDPSGAWKALWNRVVEITEKVWETLTTEIPKIWAFLQPAIQGVWEELKPRLQALAQEISDRIGPMLDTLKEKIVPLAKDIGKEILQAGGFEIDMGNFSWLETGKNLVGIVKALLWDIPGKFLEGLNLPGWDSWKESLVSAGENFGKFIDFLGTAVSNAAQLWSDFKGGIQAIIDFLGRVVDGGANFWGDITSGFTAFFTSLANHASNFFTEFVSQGKHIFNMMLYWFKLGLSKVEVFGYSLGDDPGARPQAPIYFTPEQRSQRDGPLAPNESVLKETRFNIIVRDQRAAEELEISVSDATNNYLDNYLVGMGSLG